MQSIPFKDTAYFATNCAIVFVNNSIATWAFGLSSSYEASSISLKSGFNPVIPYNPDFLFNNVFTSLAD